MTLNPIQALANQALKHSRQINLCRRAKWRAKSARDIQFWHNWDCYLQEKIISIANMLIRVRSITCG